VIVDAAKVRAKLGCQHRTSFDELAAEMVAADLKIVADERHNDA
jgi:GDP-D-mannose dehydratase